MQRAKDTEGLKADDVVALGSDRASIDEQHQGSLTRAVKAAAQTLQANKLKYEATYAQLKSNRRGSESEATTRHNAEAAETTANFDRQLRQAEDKYAAALESAECTRAETWQRISDRWQSGLVEVNAKARESAELAEGHFPGWPPAIAGEAALAQAVPAGIRFGEYIVEAAALPGGVPTDTRLTPVEPVDAIVPAFLPFPDNSNAHGQRMLSASAVVKFGGGPGLVSV